MYQGFSRPRAILKSSSWEIDTEIYLIEGYDKWLSLYPQNLARSLKGLSKFQLLIVDEIGYLPFTADGAHAFFQLISRFYETRSIIFTSNKSYGEWGEIFRDHVIASAVLDRILHHCTTINIKGDSYRLKERRRQGLITQNR